MEYLNGDRSGLPESTAGKHLVMLGRKRAVALQERLNCLEARAIVSETLFAAIAVALRVAPDDVRNEIFRYLRASVSGGAPGSKLEREVMEIEEIVAQIIDQIEAVARGGSSSGKPG